MNKSSETIQSKHLDEKGILIPLEYLLSPQVKEEDGSFVLSLKRENNTVIKCRIWIRKDEKLPYFKRNGRAWVVGKTKDNINKATLIDIGEVVLTSFISGTWKDIILACDCALHTAWENGVKEPLLYGLIAKTKNDNQIKLAIFASEFSSQYIEDLKQHIKETEKLTIETTEILKQDIKVDPNTASVESLEELLFRLQSEFKIGISDLHIRRIVQYLISKRPYKGYDDFIACVLATMSASKEKAMYSEKEWSTLDIPGKDKLFRECADDIADHLVSKVAYWEAEAKKAFKERDELKHELREVAPSIAAEEWRKQFTREIDWKDLLIEDNEYLHVSIDKVLDLIESIEKENKIIVRIDASASFIKVLKKSGDNCFRTTGKMLQKDGLIGTFMTSIDIFLNNSKEDKITLFLEDVNYREYDFPKHVDAEVKTPSVERKPEIINIDSNPFKNEIEAILVCFLTTKTKDAYPHTIARVTSEKLQKELNYSDIEWENFKIKAKESGLLEFSKAKEPEFKSELESQLSSALGLHKEGEEIVLPTFEGQKYGIRIISERKVKKIIREDLGLPSNFKGEKI